MKRVLSWKDILPGCILAGVFLLRFDAVMAVVVFVATTGGVVAVRRHLAKKDKQ